MQNISGEKWSILLGSIEEKSNWSYCSLQLKYEVEIELPGGCGIFASSSALEKDIDYSHRYKVEPNEIDCYCCGV